MAIPIETPQQSYKTPKIIIVEWISIIGVFIICFLFLFSEIKHIEIKIDQQAVRTDRLYEMFVDLRKEGDQSRKEIDQKFYEMNQRFVDLRKEGDQSRKEVDQKFYEMNQRFYDILKEKNNNGR